MELIDYDGLKNFLTDSNLVNELENLTEQERQLLIQMAKELSDKGSSNVLKSLWYEDYEEVPVDIDTFLDDPRYFGDVLEGSIYPYWREMLRNIFAPGSKYFEVIFSCLTGDTEIPCLDGKVRTIKEIVDLVNKGEVIYVYSFDRDKHEYTIGKVVNGIMNGCRTTFEVTLDNGKSFRLTSDHKILMRDNTWKETKDLRIGDSLMPFDRRINSDDREFILQPKKLKEIEFMRINEKTYKKEFTHYMSYKWKMNNDLIYNADGTRRDIYHKDKNHRNNNPENLIAYNKTQHPNLRTDIDKEKAIMILSDSNSVNEALAKLNCSKTKLVAVMDDSNLKQYLRPDITLDLVLKTFNESISVVEVMKKLNCTKQRLINILGTSKLSQFLKKNHKVIKIDYNAMLLPVYDIEIETYHNFALDAGCTVKNCSIGR